MTAIIVSFFAMILLAATFLQDVRERAVHVLIFPLLLLCLGYLSITTQPLWNVLQGWSMNILFLLIQVSFLYLYFLLTRRKRVAVVGTAMGLGDIFFWLVAAVFFSLPNFIFFFLGSLLVALFLHYAIRLIFKESYKTTVPLAGFQALVLLVLLVVKQVHPSLDFYHDGLVLEMLAW